MLRPSPLAMEPRSITVDQMYCRWGLEETEDVLSFLQRHPETEGCFFSVMEGWLYRLVIEVELDEPVIYLGSK